MTTLNTSNSITASKTAKANCNLQAMADRAARSMGIEPIPITAPPPVKTTTQAEPKPTKSRSGGNRPFTRRKKKKAQRKILSHPKIDKLWQKCLAAGQYGPRPEEIDRETWKMIRAILSDASGWATWHYLSTCKHRQASVLIDRAATAEGSYCYYGRSRGSRRARKIAALGLAILATAEYDRARTGLYRFTLRTVPVLLLQAICTEPGEPRISRNSICRTYEPDTKKTDELKEKPLDFRVGYLTALKNIGFLESYQEVRLATATDKAQAIKPARNGSNQPGWVCHTNEYYIVKNWQDDDDGEQFSQLFISLTLAASLMQTTQPRQFCQRPPPTLPF